jgi:hypothetical protein
MNSTATNRSIDLDPRMLEYASAIFDMASSRRATAAHGLKQLQVIAPRLTPEERSYAEDSRVAEIYCRINGFSNVTINSRAEAIGRLIAVIIRSTNPDVCREAAFLAKRLSRCQDPSVVRAGLLAAADYVGDMEEEQGG